MLQYNNYLFFLTHFLIFALFQILYMIYFLKPKFILSFSLVVNLKLFPSLTSLWIYKLISMIANLVSYLLLFYSSFLTHLYVFFKHFLNFILTFLFLLSLFYFKVQIFKSFNLFTQHKNKNISNGNCCTILIFSKYSNEKKNKKQKETFHLWIQKQHKTKWIWQAFTKVFAKCMNKLRWNKYAKLTSQSKNY